MTLESAHILFNSLIDYAGLFPPAKLDLHTAIHNYAEYKSGKYAPLLGSFILPISKLDEFHNSLSQKLDEFFFKTLPWSLSLTFDKSTDIQKFFSATRTFSSLQSEYFSINSLEVKVSDVSQINEVSNVVPDFFKLYLEVPLTNDLDSMIEAIAQVNRYAKVRTGGLSSDLFPTIDALIKFLQTCIKNNVGFKATAGLHHLIRSTYKITYEPDSSSTTMHGFLNLFLAVALLLKNNGKDEARKLFEETSLDSFKFDNNSVFWNSIQLDNKILQKARTMAMSFGSCSFEEPISELREANLL